MRWSVFREKYPSYSRFRFSADERGNVQFNFNGQEYDPFDAHGNLTKTLYRFPSYEGHTYEPENIQDFLNSDYKEVSPFPKALLLSHKRYSVPAAPFEKSASDIAPLLRTLQIFATPKSSFAAGVRDVFRETVVTHKTAKEARRWLSGPNFAYWPQQLNFAVWCATAGCGVSLGDPSFKSYPPVVQGFLRFHVYFTIRRILYELGAALPGDSGFAQKDNPYVKSALDRLCTEFGLKKGAADFRWKGGYSNGLGDTYIRYPNGSLHNLRVAMPGNHVWPGGFFKFPDEKEATAATRLAYMQNNEHGGAQYSWFAPPIGEGLTEAGLARLNRSVEAFVYAVLGAQVNVRSSIVSRTASGSSKEAQQEFVKLLEDAIVENDIAQSVQRYQLAVQEAKLRLDLAITPGCWLLPSELVINTESVVGYNNELQCASRDMKFGVNDVNEGTKKVGIVHMLGGQSKVKRPNSHPSNDVVRDNKTAVTPKMSSDGRPDGSADSHLELKVGLTALGALAGYYLLR